VERKSRADKIPQIKFIGCQLAVERTVKGGWGRKIMGYRNQFKCFGELKEWQNSQERNKKES
jgi:hypothetical protein